LGQKIISRPDPQSSQRPGKPAVIFGGRNKLTADWPFFDIFWHWRNSLEDADTIWVIGYSFRDEHVDAVLLNWLGSDSSRRLVIVDPSFQDSDVHPLHPILGMSSTEVRGHLVKDPNSPTGTRYQPGPPDDPQIVVLRMKAGDALVALEEAYPGMPSLRVDQ
jgi:hypothetical protein